MTARRKLLALAAVISAFVLLPVVGCGSDAGDGSKHLKVAAAPDPKGDITKFVIDLAAKRGIELELVTTTNSVNDHQLLEDGDVDIDFNSHVPWFNDQVEQNGFEQTFVQTVFLTPTGLYSENVRSLGELPAGARIAISKDVPNQARSLGFLQSAGLITLRSGASDLSTVTLADIATNPRGLRWVEVDLEATPRALPDVDAAVILGTIATAAGLKLEEALAREPANNPLWAIGIVARTADVDDPRYQQVFALFNSDEVRTFITDEYPAGQVIPAFGPPTGVVRP
ncbi:MetQ/NlpA family ABC transporter substrate-binding protein [Nocardia sp. NPDC057227]|uniref:MetQ/NlpA family ABC transporter substrate-binding protein n=1 Tax=Nocardia sp. NPDC057227 TaxID=3346056 RepID=UPI003627237B